MKPMNMSWKQKLALEKAAALDAGTSEPTEALAPVPVPPEATKAESTSYSLTAVRLATTLQVVDKPCTSLTRAHYDLTFLPNIQCVMAISKDHPDMGYALVPFTFIQSMDFRKNEE